VIYHVTSLVIDMIGQNVGYVWVHNPHILYPGR